MSKKLEAVAGERYGNLLVIGSAPRNEIGGTMALCLCDCGVEKAFYLSGMRRGKIKSCGCINRDPEKIKRGADSLKRKWASGTRKAPPPEMYKKLADSRRGKPNPPGRCSKDIDNWAAKYWYLIGPNMVVLEGINLCNLVRDNSHLFHPRHLQWKDGLCRAVKGLYSLFEIGRDGEPRTSSWMGWRIGDRMTREQYNDGQNISGNAGSVTSCDDRDIRSGSCEASRSS
ncbi:MAG TPA: hypothetical protein VF800_02430 [Telluria sp.]